MKSSGTVDAGGTKVLLTHFKDRIVLSKYKCYERKFWCMLLQLCLILGKYLAANVKKGYWQVGNELLHETGSFWIV